jgi:aspartyl protease family protein
MKMLRVRYLTLAFIGIAAAVIAQTTPPTPADLESEQLLKSKGLARAGIFWALDEDLKSQDDLRPVAKMRALMDENARKRSAAELDLRKVDAQSSQLDRQYQSLNDQISKRNLSVDEHNQLAGQINSIAARLRELLHYKEQREKDMKSLPDGQNDYIAALTALSTKFEQTSQRYTELAADKDVATALGKLSDTTKLHLRLGPTPAFAQRLALVRKDLAGVQQTVIKLDFDGGVPCVDVTLNGKITRRMVVDSGAATVLITASVARELDMTPGPNDPVIHMMVANGKKVDGHLMHLKSIRLAQFEVQDVECAVLPNSVGEGAGMLLGGTFLRNFDYRMDLEAGQLHLSQVTNKPATSQPAPQPLLADVPPGELLPTMRGDTSHKDGSAIVLQAKQHISTDRWYTPPVLFKVIAMTDSTNLRLRYGVKEIIFNWELNPSQLRIDGGIIASAHKDDAGSIPVNQYVTIELAVEPDSMTLSVNGEQRQRISANFSEVQEPLTIYTNKATLHIKSVQAVEGK